MPDRPHLVPGPDHPITITQPTDQRIVVRAAGETVADSTRALALAEADYPVAYYLPMADVNSSVLEPTQTQTYCPYKGDASYWSVVGSEGRIEDAVWGYRTPYPAVAQIADHVAFYPDRVEIIVGPVDQAVG